MIKLIKVKLQKMVVKRQDPEKLAIRKYKNALIGRIVMLAL